MKAYIYIIFSYIIAIIIAYLSFLYFKESFSLLISTLLADIVCTIIIFMFSMIVNNSSIYDPYWSVIPPFLFILWMIEINAYSIYSWIILVSILLWAIRLTYNWTINWKGFKHEDWRYIAFRKQFKRGYWLISFLAVHLFPTLIVFLGMLPLYKGLLEKNVLYPLLFIMGILIILLGVGISYFADIHLTLHRNSDDYEKSIDIGIWKYTRHPNYLGELTFWFGCLIVGLSYQVTNYYIGIGFVGMVLLFNFFSIPTMERRLMTRKDDYHRIREQVPKLWPFKINLFKK